MKAELQGAFLGPLFGELTDLAQGADKLIIPCGWPKNFQFNSGWLWVFIEASSGTPSTNHVFTFYKNGGTSLGTVTVTAGAGPIWGSTAFSLPSGGLKGFTDYVAVDHDTHASHASDGDRIWAGLYPTVPR